MKVETYLFGAVEVSPEKVITFPNGLVAFEDNKRFMLAHESDKGQPASYTLQSLDDAGLAFQIVYFRSLRQCDFVFHFRLIPELYPLQDYACP